MVLNVLGPARGRGRYDRHQDAQERRQQQRERVASAVCAVLAEVGAHRVSVARVTTQARVGRNTFYEHFTDIPEALDAASQLAAEGLLGMLDSSPLEARTPVLSTCPHF